MWILFSFITSLSESTKDVLGKLGKEKTTSSGDAFALNSIATLFLAIPLLYNGIPEIVWYYWPVLMAQVVLRSSWTVLYFRALRFSSISRTVPLLALTPVLTAVLAVFFDRRFPTFYGWIGISIIVIGLYLSRITEGVHDILEPVKNVFTDKGSQAMFLVALIWSIGGHISKLGVTYSSPYFSGFMGSFFSMVAIALVMYYRGLNPIEQFKTDKKRLTALGFLDAVSEITMRLALQTGLTAYVFSIKRTSILWSSLVSIVLFKEKFSPIKTIGILTAFAGIVLLVSMG